MIRKEMVHTILQQTPGPLNYAGLMALVHRQSGSQDALHLFARIEQHHLDEVLAELAGEGRVKVKFTETALYEVVE